MGNRKVHHHWKQAVAALLMLVIFASATCVTAFAEPDGRVRQYKVYTSLGDSCGSGFGLPEYNAAGKFVQYGRRITGAYPDLVANAVRAKKLNQMCVPDFRTNELRFLLDNGNQGDWILETQAWNMTLGGYNKEVLKSWRPAYQKAVKQADLITLDIGVNDTWFDLIAWVYSVKQDGLVSGYPQGTLEQELATYGPDVTIQRNVQAFLNAIFTRPGNLPTYAGTWLDMIIKYLTDFYNNYRAIVKQIYALNPDVTIVALSSYNPYKAWSVGNAGPIVGGGYTALNLIYQPMLNTMNQFKQSFETEYRGQYYYVDVTQTELFCDTHPFLSLYENTTMYGNSGFNPHPTPAGHQYEASKIIEALPARVY